MSLATSLLICRYASAGVDEEYQEEGEYEEGYEEDVNGYEQEGESENF